MLNEPRGPGQQAEHDEHDDLGKPRGGVEKRDHDAIPAARILAITNHLRSSAHHNRALTSTAYTERKPSSNRTTGPVSAAVSRTPTVASTSEGASALRNVASRVRRPPSNRIKASATAPTR